MRTEKLIGTDIPQTTEEGFEGSLPQLSCLGGASKQAHATESPLHQQ